MEILRNYKLKRLNTFNVDVMANYFTTVKSEKDLLRIFQMKDLPSTNILILGGGSNILFTGNFNGLVIHNNIKDIKVIDESEDSVLIEACAGENWDEFVKFCVENNFGGIENLSLIPGTVGAAPFQNIGAYGTELKDLFHSLEGFFVENAEKKIFFKEDCRFEYRNSIFKRELKNKFVITKVTCRLNKYPVPNLKYEALEKAVNDSDIENPTISDIRRIIIDIRKSKLPDFEKFGNAGSFFKNPSVSNEKFSELSISFPDMAYFKENEDSYKIPAGWLIEKCGLKGKRIENVGTYDKQALVIINYGGAAGKEILDFAELVKEKVFKKFKIELIPEVNVIH